MLLLLHKSRPGYLEDFKRYYTPTSLKSSQSGVPTKILGYAGIYIDMLIQHHKHLPFAMLAKKYKSRTSQCLLGYHSHVFYHKFQSKANYEGLVLPPFPFQIFEADCTFTI